MEVLAASVEASDEKKESTAGHRRKGDPSFLQGWHRACLSCALVFVFEIEIRSDKVVHQAEQSSRPHAEGVHASSQL